MNLWLEVCLQKTSPDVKEKQNKGWLRKKACDLSARGRTSETSRASSLPHTSPAFLVRANHAHRAHSEQKKPGKEDKQT